MIFSGVFFAATFIIPMFNLPTKTKVIASTTSLVLMEVVFWSGGLLVGKELFTKYKAQLNPKNWFAKKALLDEVVETTSEQSKKKVPESRNL